MKQYSVSAGCPDVMGVSIKDGVLNAAVENTEYRPATLNLYNRRSKKLYAQIPFDENAHLGSIYSMRAEGIDTGDLCYRFGIGNSEFADPYAKALTGTEKYGHHEPYGLFGINEYAWENRRPGLKWRDSVIYLLNVRGFSRHKSSGTAYGGTFRGIADKTGYIKKLGVTTLLLQPAYDFDEVIKNRLTAETRTNYWGYTSGNFFAPKAAYASGDAADEFRYMVDRLHGDGIEVMMQFYFPDGTKSSFIYECLKYWVLTYMIDGFQIMGADIPFKTIAGEPVFSDTKIMAMNPDVDAVYSDGRQPVIKNIGAMGDDFMYDCRKFLKGDEDMLSLFTHHLLDNPQKCAVINYITTYYGFTLDDLVSYDRKHNENNGEGNNDGNEYNYSWNCGAEGKSRKKAVMKLRTSQIKNAMTMLFLAQGVPMLRAGDEFCNSQNGNNNAYCQDNNISYLDWTDLDKHKDIFEFTMKLIYFRREHPLFRSRDRKRMIDYMSCGYPDVSFHGEQAWSPKFENYNRHIAVMYYGAYEKLDNGRRDDDFYAAYNMHWENHIFHLPTPPKGKTWKLIMRTTEGFNEVPEIIKDNEVNVSARSIVLLKAFRDDKKK